MPKSLKNKLMPVTKDKLFLLMSKLTATEKGYVNKQLKSTNPKSNLLSLYTLINKVKPLEDADLKQKLKKSTLLKNYASTKKQLFDTILKILRTYNGQKDELRVVLTMLEDITFLYEKGMLEECKKIIKKAKKICDDVEFYGFRLHLFCLLYTSPSPRDLSTSRMPSSA